MCDETQLAAHLNALGHDPRERMNWRTTGASPFSLALRRRVDADSPLPFPATSLHAGWMPGDIYLHFMFTGPAEPVCPVIPTSLQYATWRHNIPEQTHPLRVKALTGVHIAVTPESPSPLCQWLTQSGLVTIEHGSKPLMTLTFDNGAQGNTVAVRPTLPLVLRF